MIPLAIVPSFQVGPSPFSSNPIDRIVLRAYEEGTTNMVGDLDEPVDPTAPQWVLDLTVDLGDQTSLSIVVEIELYSGQAVEWSGRSSPITASAGVTPQAIQLDVYRGPLDNLDVTSVSVFSAPTQILATQTGALEASVTLVQGSTATPVIYWASSDPTIATVEPQGIAVSMTALNPGTVQIIVGAGPSRDTVTVEILPRVQSVVVTPDPVTIQGIGSTASFTAAVTDGFGNSDPGAPVTWSTTDASVATVDAAGLATATGFGGVTVQATSFGVVGGASLTVDGPDLLPTSFTVTPDAGGNIQDLALVDLVVDIDNAGALDAGASTLEVRVLDATTQQEAHPPLTFPIPAISAGGSFTFSGQPGGQVQPVTLPSSVTFEAVVDATDAVAEEDETNNTLGSGSFTVVAVAPPGFDTEWRGTTTDWDTPANWSSGQVPLATDNVYVPASATVDPTITTGGTVQVANLTVETGAVLTVDNTILAVTGDLDAGATITPQNGGLVELRGSGATVEGLIQGQVLVTGTITTSGDFAADRLDISGSGSRFGVGAHIVQINGPLLTVSGGTLEMTTAGAVMSITRGDFFGGDQTGLLTEGILSFAGDLRITGVGTNQFVASGNHQVDFDLGGQYEVRSTIDTADLPAFGSLRILGNSDVLFQNQTSLDGTLDLVAGSLEVPLGLTMDVTGAITVAAGFSMYIDGDLTTSATCTNNGAFIVGRGTQPCGTAPYTRAWRSRSVGSPTDWADDANWVPAGVPAATDDVLVASSLTDPALSQNETVQELFVGAGATLTMNGFDLTVQRDFEGNGSIVNGSIVIAAGGTTLHGNADNLVIGQNANRNLSGSLNLTGNLVLDGFLDTGASTTNTVGGNLDVTGGLTVPSGGTVNVTGGVTLGQGANFDIDGTVTAGGSCVDNGANISGTGTHPCGGGPTTRTWIGGDAQGPTLWEVAGNWSPVGVPAPGDAVTIASANDTPILGANTTINTLQVDGSMNIDLGNNTLTVASTINVDGTVTNGVVEAATGTQIGVAGTFDELLVTGIRGQGGNQITTNGDLIIAGSGRLNLNGFGVNVVGNFSTVGDGIFTMNNGLAVVTVFGDALFAGGTLTQLADGEIRFRGDFYATDANFGTYNSTTNHTTIFDGSSPQTIQMDVSNSADSKFNNLEFAAGSQVTVLSPIWVQGPVDLDGVVTVPVGSDITMGGGFTLRSSGTLDVDGFVATRQTCDDQGGTITGTGYHPCNALQPKIWIGGSPSGPTNWDVALNWSPNGVPVGSNDVIIPSRAQDPTFALNLAAANNVEVWPAATLGVPAGDLMGIGGILTLQAGSFLDVDGTLSAIGGCVNNGATITGSGTHPCTGGPQVTSTWVGGDAGGPTDHLNANNWMPVGVPGNADTVLIPATANDPVMGSGWAFNTLYINPGATLDLGANNLNIAHNIDVDGDITNGLISINGPGTLLEGDFDRLTFNTPSRTASGTINTTGDFILNDSDFDVGGQTVNVGGAFTTNGGNSQLIMQDIADVLDVAGHFIINGGSTSGFLTAGELRVGGNLDQLNTNSSLSFVATGSHRVVFDGTGPQNVTFNNPGTTTSRFRDVQFANTSATVTLQSDVVASAFFSVLAGANVSALGRTLSVAGSLTSTPANLALTNLSIYGDMISLAPNITATDITVSGTTLNVPNTTTFNGNVTIVNATVVMGTSAWTINGNLDINTAGRLQMTDAAAIVDVNGNATFNGTSHTNSLTNGTLRVAGDLTSTGASSTGFRAQTAHTTILDGTGAQSVNIFNPASNLEHFYHLVVQNTGGTVTLDSNAVVNGDFSVVIGANVDASNDFISVAGSYASNPADITLQELRLHGNVTGLPATIGSDVVVSVVVDVPNTSTVTGNVSVVTGGVLNLGANTWNIGGDFTATSAGRLQMTNAASVVDIDGSATFDGASHNNSLTAGTLRIAGNLIATAASSSGFRSQTAHTTVLDGTGPQAISFTNPASNLQHFFNLDVQNTGAAVTFLSDAFINGAFTVAASANVDASNDFLSIAGSYSASPSDITLQELRIHGDLTAWPSTIASDVVVNSLLNVPGSTAITGNVDLNAVMVVAGNTVGMSGNLNINAGGRLQMTNLADIVDVDGNALFDGTSHNNSLTMGTLNIAGDLTATASSSTGFRAQTAHTTVLDGTGAQSVSLAAPATNLQHFWNLDVQNTSGTVTLASNVVVNSAFNVASGGNVDASNDWISIGGSYAAASTDITLQELRTHGDLTAMPATIQSDVQVNAQLTVPNTTSITGQVDVNNAVLIMNGFTWNISGNLLINTGGRLQMTNAADVVDVDGDAAFNGVSHSNSLTQGVLRVAGNFSASASSSTSFRAQTAHTTVLDGGFVQAVTFTSPATNLQHFFNLDITNASGTVTFGSDAVVNGAFTVAGGPTSVDASNDWISVQGSYSAAPANISLQELRIHGDLTAWPTTIQSDVQVNALLNVPGDAAITGNVDVNSATLIIGSNTVSMTGDLNINTGGRLQMTDAASVVTVTGNATFAGVSHSNSLTNGTLSVGGNLSATASSTTSFRAQTAHTTVLNGSGAQSISFTSPGNSTQHLFNLDVQNTAGTVTLGSNAFVNGAFTVQPNATVSAPTEFISVAGSYSAQPADITLQELRIHGDLTAMPATVQSDVQVNAQLNVPNTTSITGNVDVNSATLIMGGNTWNISGDLNINAGARLQMTNNLDVVDVDGNATFAGVSHSNSMTQGTLRIAGDLTASGSTTAFRSQTAHTTQLDGALNQRINFSSPAVNQQHFFNLDVLNTAGTVFVDTDMFVNGLMSAGAATFSGTSTIQLVNTIASQLSMDGTTFSGTPVRLDSNLTGSNHTLDNITFTGMDVTATQLYLEIPGTEALQLNGTNFQTVPTTGFYVSVVSSNAQTWQLQMQSPTPGNASETPGGYQTDGVAFVTWPWP